VVRGKGKVLSVPVFSWVAALKFCRQVVKQSKELSAYQAVLPIVTRVGGQLVEFDSPGTQDIYAFPLVPAKSPLTPAKRETPDEESKKTAARENPKKKRKVDADQYKREGGTADHTWASMEARLTSQKTTNRDRVFGPFSGKMPAESTPIEALVTSAMTSDLMKGVAGGLAYVKEAESALTKGSSYKTVYSGGDKRVYAPAKAGGRSLVTSRHLIIKQEMKKKAAAKEKEKEKEKNRPAKKRTKMDTDDDSSEESSD
jgi:hypothetical protein